MPVPEGIAFIVDDDPSVRQSLKSLTRAAGWRVESFASAQEFLACPDEDAPSCLVHRDALRREAELRMVRSPQAGSITGRQYVIGGGTVPTA